MSSVKMIKLEDGDYVPEECCTFGRNFETGEMEVDDVSLPCGCDCSRGGNLEISCESCVIQKIMNEYGEQEENGWIPVSERLPEERNSIFVKFKGTDNWKNGMFEKASRYVIVTVAYDDGTLLVERAHTTDGKWKTEKPILGGKVIAWKEFPEPYKGSKKGERDEQRNS